MIRRFVPVYLITGFLESGKTTLGLTILGNERFTNGGKTLIVCCEDGEKEWDAKSLEKYKGVLVMLEEEEEILTIYREDEKAYIDLDFRAFEIKTLRLSIG